MFFNPLVMRPSSLGGAAYCVALCLSVCLSVCPSVPLSLPSVTSFRQPLASRMYFSARTEGIRTFRHALRAAYRTAISAAQILVILQSTIISVNFQCIMLFQISCFGRLSRCTGVTHLLLCFCCAIKVWKKLFDCSAEFIICFHFSAHNRVIICIAFKPVLRSKTRVKCLFLDNPFLFAKIC